MRGKVTFICFNKKFFRDHPRTCGEKLRPSSSERYTLRITPAHAGKSQNLDGDESQAQDHPRTCGEKQLFRIFLCLLLGSPPHMRGKVRVISTNSADARITPAHAGKSAISKN